MTAPAHAPNRLQHETSPYLLQHARNPVDWYPWGPEAIERARRERKPIFLSIGYSACHWCHVMERECFEQVEIAALMNRLYVNIKVDREERPDIDEIYMKAVTALSGSGGWPMSVFLTPELQPFYGATYLPPERRHGRPSFPEVLTALAEAWDAQREAVVEQAQRLTDAIVQQANTDLRGRLDADVLQRAHAHMLQTHDATWGGFGPAPKFPHSGDLRLLLRAEATAGAQDAAVHTLERMARGGIHDQLGGGFHRYSTDVQWRIPHFEKMLYDTALLVVVYLEAHLRTGREDFAAVAVRSCDWVLREMSTPQSAFASAQDADSEGEEGRYYVWTPAQLNALLGPERGARLAAYFDVTDAGNFEHGTSALWRPRASEQVAAELGIEPTQLEAEVDEARPVLLAARAQRVAPATDDKVLVAWNGLMISALCRAYQVLDDVRYLDAASRAARYLLTGLRQPDGRLFATARAGRAHIDACLDDYAFLVQALIDLYESDFDPSWIDHALQLADQVETRFRDTMGGYFTTGEGHESLIARTKNWHDAALPAGGAVQALNLLRLARLCGRDDLDARARGVIDAHAQLANRHPQLFAQLLLAVDFAQRDPVEVVISGRRDAQSTRALLRVARRSFGVPRVVALTEGGPAPAALALLNGREPRGAEALAYVCRNHACQAPIADPAELERALQLV